MAATVWKIALLSAAALTLAGATCNSGEKPPAAQPEPVAPAGQVLPKTQAKAAQADLDLSGMLPGARQELETVFSDEFCYCGCPHTLGACLQEHRDCRHAKRMAALAARHAEAGLPGPEIILILSRYYEGFRTPRKPVPTDDRMCLGPKDAKVTLTEYFDYECPYCAAAHPILKAFAAKYQATLRYCVVPYALPNHPNAVPATQAALMARDAGKFWAMHDWLLENQHELSPGAIRQQAARIGLDADALGAAMASGKYVDEIERFRAEGKAAGVDMTPLSFLNGRRFQLDLTETNLVHAVDDELEWVAHGRWAAD